MHRFPRGALCAFFMLLLIGAAALGVIHGPAGAAPARKPAKPAKGPEKRPSARDRFLELGVIPVTLAVDPDTDTVSAGSTPEVVVTLSGTTQEPDQQVMVIASIVDDPGDQVALDRKKKVGKQHQAKRVKCPQGSKKSEKLTLKMIPMDAKGKLLVLNAIGFNKQRGEFVQAEQPVVYPIK